MVPEVRAQDGLDARETGVYETLSVEDSAVPGNGGRKEGSENEGRCDSNVRTNTACAYFVAERQKSSGVGGDESEDRAQAERELRAEGNLLQEAHQRFRSRPEPWLSGLSQFYSSRSRRQLTLEQQIMDEHQKPEEAAKSGQDYLKSAAGDLKEAAGAKIENIRQAAGQKADELRGAAQDKVQELRGAGEKATSQAKSWQAEGEAYVRDNPTKAVLVALGVGLLLGFLLRK